MLLQRTTGARRDPIQGRTLPRQQRHHNDKAGSGGGASSGGGGGGAPGASAGESGGSNGFYGGGGSGEAAVSSSNGGGGGFAGDGAGGGGDFGRGGKGKGMGKGGKGGPMRVRSGKTDNRGYRENNYKEKDFKSAKQKQMDSEFSWRATTKEEADAAIDTMGKNPRHAPGQASSAGRAADTTSTQEPEADSVPEQESPRRELWPALGAGLAANPEAQGAPAHANSNSTNSTSVTYQVAMQQPFRANADGQGALEDASAQLPARPSAKAQGFSPQSVGAGGSNASPQGPPSPGLGAGAAPSGLGAAAGATGAPTQKSLPVKASTKAYARSNPKAAMPKVQAPFAAQAATLAVSPNLAAPPPSAMPCTSPAVAGPNEGAVTKAAAPVMTPGAPGTMVTTGAPGTMVMTMVMMPEGGTPGPSGGGATAGLGPSPTPKVMPTPVVPPAATLPAPAPAAGGPPGNTSASGNSEALPLVETADGDGPELKTLLGRGAAPPGGDAADAKIGRGGVRLQGVEDWVLYLQPRREGVPAQEAPVRRAVAGARGRGRGRLVNVRLDRVRGAGRATTPTAGGEDGSEAFGAIEEIPQQADVGGPDLVDLASGSIGDSSGDAIGMPTTGTSSSSLSAPTPSPAVMLNGTPATNSWAAQSSAPQASATVGRGGTQFPRRRGRAWEDLEGALDVDGTMDMEEPAPGAAVSSTSGSSALAASGTAADVSERRPSAGEPTEGSPAMGSTASAAQASEAQGGEDDGQISAPVGTAAVSSTSSATAASSDRRPCCPATGSTSEPTLEGSPAVASPAVASDAQVNEASSSSTSPASAGAAPSSATASVRPRPEASAPASATSAVASGAAPASGTSAGNVAGFMRLALDVPPGAGEAAAGPWAGGWERNFRRDDELLRACGLWCKKVEADGACLFRAFSDQLEGDGGSMHLQYREKCVSYMEEYRADFEPFIDSNFKGYCAKLREPAAWGGHVEAQALSRALGVNALIHLPADAEAAEDVPEKAIEVLNFGEDAPCVQLCFHPRYHSGPHYNSVRCCGDKGEGIPLATSVTQMRERMLEVLRTRRQRQGGTAS